MLEFYLGRNNDTRKFGVLHGTFLRNVHDLKLGLSVEARHPQGAQAAGPGLSPCALPPCRVALALARLGPREGKDTSTGRGRPDVPSISAFRVSASPGCTVRAH